jgi:hypothetical protein
MAASLVTRRRARQVGQDIENGSTVVLRMAIGLAHANSLEGRGVEKVLTGLSAAGLPAAGLTPVPLIETPLAGCSFLRSTRRGS